MTSFPTNFLTRCFEYVILKNWIIFLFYFTGKERPDHYGTLIPLGHIDFYPNAAGLQPGCRDFVQRSNNIHDSSGKTFYTRFL